MRSITIIVVHHTDGNADDTADDVDRVHAARGFARLGGVHTGYHYVIETDGTLRLGRPDVYMGAHARGHNADSVGVALIGAYHLGDPVPELQRRQAVALVADLCRRHGLQAEAVKGHGELVATLCPGFPIDSFRADVGAQLVRFA